MNTMKTYRPLTAEKIAVLERLGNVCDDWNCVKVADGFDAEKVRGCTFSGHVCIGTLPDGKREADGVHLPVGLVNSRINDCNIGDSCALYDVRYISGYTIGDECLLLNIASMCASEDGGYFPERIEVVNENGHRPVYPFPEMRCSDAWLMAAYPHDTVMIAHFKKYSEAYRSRAEIGKRSVIMNVQRISYFCCGSSCVISGVMELERLTVRSVETSPVRISGNVVLHGGIISPGCEISGGCIAKDFVLCENSRLGGGVRFFNSILGDNSTVNCCEVVSSLIFPVHEQHHNNSFLIAACVGGQSNIPAGATIGSNHNSRAADGEIHVGRGFWPCLCVSLKHSSQFASFCLIVKGSYPNELDIRLPFCLVSNNENADRLELLPAYLWLYNMYNFLRNERKFRSRDRRVIKEQNIEFSTLAPDTVQEIVVALAQLRSWVEKYGGEENLELIGEGVEKGSRTVLVRHVSRAMEAYRQMIVHFAMTEVLTHLRSLPESADRLEELRKVSKVTDSTPWVNVGGQLMRKLDVEKLRALLREDENFDPGHLHRYYDRLWEHYRADKLHFAVWCLQQVCGVHELKLADWESLLGEEKVILGLMCSRAEQSRRKDFENPFRAAVCPEGEEEFASVYGSLADDTILRDIRAENTALSAEIEYLYNLMLKD